MSNLERLLSREPAVATVGIDLLAEAVESQGATVVRTDWRPPLEGTEDALASLAVTCDQEAANAEAVRRLTGVHAHWTGMAVARDVIPGMGERTFLHAGPPLAWEDCSGPMRGALIGAMIYEGLAATPEEAIALGPDLELSPCHDHQAIGPMAGVVSASMPVSVIEDAAGDGVAYATLNEGLGKVLRYGAFAPEVIERLKWLEEVMAPVLGDALEHGGAIDLRSIISQALQMGDDGHNRNRAATSLLLRELGKALVGGPGPAGPRSEVFGFIHSNDHFMLNLVMAAGKLGIDAASGDDPQRHRVRHPVVRYRRRMVHGSRPGGGRPLPGGIHRRGRQPGHRGLGDNRDDRPGRVRHGGLTGDRRFRGWDRRRCSATHAHHV